jgi:hypothetical protein
VRVCVCVCVWREYVRVCVGVCVCVCVCVCKFVLLQIYRITRLHNRCKNQTCTHGRTQNKLNKIIKAEKQTQMKKKITRKSSKL